jgi:Ca-activated chloride channel family protein
MEMMKKTKLFLAAVLLGLLCSCGNEIRKNPKDMSPPTVIEEVPEFEDQSVEESTVIAIPNSDIPPPPPPPPPPPAVEEIFRVIPPQQGQRQNWNTEAYDHISENEFHQALETPLSTFSVDVDKAAYSNCRRMLNDGQLPIPSAVRIEELINYFQYDYPEPTGEHPFSVSTELADCPWQKEHKLLHIGLKGKELPRSEAPASNLVFLLDVSGSMRHPNKLPLLVNAFKLLVNQLREEDQVAIVVYAGASGLVLPPTSGNKKGVILNALEQLRAGGSTAGAAGIQLAYKTAQEHFIQGGNNRVILATDGDFNVGTSSDGELVRLIEEKRESGIALSVLGFGTGNLKDSKMEKLADNGNGNYAYIDNLLEAKKVFVNEFSGTLFTIAKDVKIQIEFNPTQVQAYRLIGYENRKLNKEDFNDDTKDAGEIGAGHTVTALYEIVPASAGLSAKANVDPLKYQERAIKKSANQEEWMTVKLRYKKPDADESQLLSTIVRDRDLNFAGTTDNFRFSAAVASFGMLLRDSKFKGESTYASILNLARNAKGKDDNGDRSEFIKLVELAESLTIVAED